MKNIKRARRPAHAVVCGGCGRAVLLTKAGNFRKHRERPGSKRTCILSESKA